MGPHTINIHMAMAAIPYFLEIDILRSIDPDRGGSQMEYDLNIRQGGLLRSRISRLYWMSILEFDNNPRKPKEK
jgi:hypothetical protein